MNGCDEAIVFDSVFSQSWFQSILQRLESPEDTSKDHIEPSVDPVDGYCGGIFENALSSIFTREYFGGVTDVF